MAAAGGGVGWKLDDLQHVNELVQLLGDLLDGVCVTLGHDGDAGNTGVFGGAHSQGEDVEQSAGDRPETRVRTPGLSSTRTDRVC